MRLHHCRPIGVARDLAATIAKGRPYAMQLSKRAIDEGMDADPHDAAAIEQDAIRAAVSFSAQRDDDTNTGGRDAVAGR